MSEEKPIFIESNYIEKYSPEQVNYVRLISGIDEPDATTLRKILSEQPQGKNGGSTP